MKDAKMSPPAPTSGKRGGRSATMGSEEWTRQRKDNHVSLLLSQECHGFDIDFGPVGIYRKKSSAAAVATLMRASMN